MNKVIIGIHGLGNKPPKYLLKKWWKASLAEGLISIGTNKNLPVFEMVYWADYLHEKPLNKWEKDKDNLYFLREPYKKATKNNTIKQHSLRKKTFGFLSKQLNKIFLNEDNTLNYSFITDVILKKFFKDLEIYYNDDCKDKNDITCKLRDLLRSRLAQTLNKYKNYDIMIIAHSMGSIIAFDVLNFLIPTIKINTLVTIGSPLGLPIVISKIATEQKKKTQTNGISIISTPPGITKMWYNYADIRDPVAFNHKLVDVFSENCKGVRPTDFFVNNDYEMGGDNNPHKSFGYLRSQELSKILSDFIGDKKPFVGKILFEKIKELFKIVRYKLNIK